MDLEIYHNNDASPDFITDVVLEGIDSPPVKYWEDGQMKSLPKVNPRFIVLLARRDTRSHGKGNLNHSVTVYRLVLMDGSQTLFKAVTNSGLSTLMKDHEIWPGMTLIVKEWTFIEMEKPSPYQFSKIMLIHNMGWRLPPKYNMYNNMSFESPLRGAVKISQENSPVVETPPEELFRIFKPIVDRVSQTGVISFTYSTVTCTKRYPEGSNCNLACNKEKLPYGDWIIDPATRCDWTSFIVPFIPVDSKKRPPPPHHPDDSDDETVVLDCNCVMDFGLLECVTKTLPVEKLDLDQIFLTCASRFHGQVLANASSFDDLPKPSNKRWCLYWWYAVNVYQIRGGARPLPSCLVEYVRSLYPNLNGESFVGYRTTLERADV